MRTGLTGMVLLLALSSGAGQAHAGPEAAGEPPLFTLTSPAPADVGLFGSAVAGVPDVDGDGVDDVLVGAENETPPAGSAEAGLVHVFSGATGSLVRTLSSPNAEPGGGFGSALAGLPDLTGDGVGELLVGAPFEDAAGSSSGRAYLLSGAGDLLQTWTSPTPEPFGFFGRSVSWLAGPAGVTVAVAAPSEDGGEPNAGRVHLFDAATGPFLRTLVSPAPEPFGDFGSALGQASDVDVDGTLDLIVGAQSESEGGLREAAGHAYVFSGGSGTLQFTMRAPRPRQQGHFGLTVSGVPDIDGDGRREILVGELPVDPTTGLPTTGTAYLFSSVTGDLLRQFTSPSTPQAGAFGHAVAGVPDLDGDGRGEVLVGAPSEATRGGGRGRAYVLSGTSGVVLAALDSPAADPNASFGSAVAGIGESAVAGGEILVGAPGVDEGQLASAGRAYVLPGTVRSDLALVVTPLSESVPRGGVLRLDVTVTNGGVEVVTADLRLRLLGPGGGSSTIVLARNARLAPGVTRMSVAQIPVSATATVGQYRGIVAASSPNALLGSDVFFVTVTAAS